MLTEGNMKYLETISDSGMVHLQPFNPMTQVIASEIISRIREALPSADVFYFGSSALGLFGENDIDLGVIDAQEYVASGATLESLFGLPLKIDEKNHVVRWEFVQEGFLVELFLSDALAGRRREHLHNHELLQEDEQLRDAYQNLKRASVGLPKREYMKKKLEFFNALAVDNEHKPPLPAV